MRRSTRTPFSAVSGLIRGAVFEPPKDKSDVKRTGKSGGYYTFEARSQYELSGEQVVNLQIKAGYHPSGYGGPWDIKTTFKDGLWITTWRCSDYSD